MRRLYLQIYVMFVAVGIGSLMVSSLLVSLLVDHADVSLDAATQAVARIAVVGDAELQPTVTAIADELDAAVTVWDAEGRVLATDGEVAYGPPGMTRRYGRFEGRVDLPDGRRVGARERRGSRAIIGLAWLAALAAAVAVGCYPIARRVTRRLELTESAVRQWGRGELSARAPVLGRDEVARVAETFNVAAAEVERLFEAQRRVLASASHELRSPLARLRVAVQLAAEGIAPEGWTDGAIVDIEDLDAIVGDLLQVGRMQAHDGPPDPEALDLYALVAAEVADDPDVTLSGSPTELVGDRRLLVRLVRNLVDNAHRHGAPPIEIVVGDGQLAVIDAGPGVDPAFEDRIFEPFVHHASGPDGGVGLGLHLVREIARSHGGDVAYRRVAGGGSRFVVTLRAG